jgi:N-methylhydantoinase A
VALARELAIPRVLIPARPGITNALGCVVSDLRHDFVNTVNSPLATLDIEHVQAIIRQQVADGRQMIERDRVDTEELVFLYTADMQFQGQSHMLGVTISGPDVTTEELQKRFDEVYWARFAVELPDIKAVLVNLHTAVIGRRASVDLKLLAGDRQMSTIEEALRTRRQVMFDGQWHETPVFSRELLPKDLQLQGPAIIEQLDTTSVIEPGCRVAMDSIGNLIVEV